MAYRHRSSNLKQSNKKHKTGKDTSKRRIDRRDNVGGRAFHERNIKEYNAVMRTPEVEEGSEEIPTPVPVPADAPWVPPEAGPANKGDDFLVAALLRAIIGSRQVRPHGASIEQQDCALAGAQGGAHGSPNNSSYVSRASSRIKDCHRPAPNRA